MNTYEIIAEELEDISSTIIVDEVEQDYIAVDVKNTTAEDVIDTIKEIILRYSHKKREILYDYKGRLKIIDMPEVIDLREVQYDTKRGLLHLGFHVNLVEDEDERDEDELEQADREEAAFEAYREQQRGL